MDGRPFIDATTIGVLVALLVVVASILASRRKPAAPPLPRGDGGLRRGRRSHDHCLDLGFPRLIECCAFFWSLTHEQYSLVSRRRPRFG